MNKIKATPRTVTGTRQSHSISHSTLIAAIVPQSRLTADYIVLAVLLYSPDLAAPYISRLHPGDWETELHRIMARIALLHLRTIGRVDHRQLADVLIDANTIGPDAIALELSTLARVAELIHTDDIVGDAVGVLTEHRPPLIIRVLAVAWQLCKKLQLVLAITAILIRKTERLKSG